ncbi:cupin domain-containing protein [Sinorhizobium sp. RAC02]|uniref:cupin domain-containing protein n=1 Tax=Sinorhizobium sp. RAC02 TaxID=1842534 RepID=UPI00083CC5AD|nr:cupin domain-containing protein [Sinorhizobium sp. RAC02]AOF92899.1 cupin domain protein [Sinorhizobium sp. RAC02]
MHVVKFADAPPYQAAGHDKMRMVRLQGREAGPSDTVWLGVSILEPGGGTTLDSSSVEKLYVVLDGEVTVSNGLEAVVLAPWDSCRVAPREGRKLFNATDRPATILLVMPLPPAQPL